MPRARAAVTQADVARAIRAAKQEGWHSVRIVMPGGGVIELGEDKPSPHESTAPVERETEPVL